MLATTHDLLTPLALLLVAGTGAQWVASVTRLPSLLLLLVVGLLLGPIAGVLDPAAVMGNLYRPAISLAVAVVLFEGGLTLRLSELPQVGRAVHRLILVGLSVGPVVTFLIAHFLAGLDAGTATAFAAITVVTGPTVILPMLRSARIAKRPATLLKWEGIVNDPLGVLLVVLAVQVACLPQQQDSSQEVLGVLGSFAWRGVLAGLFGYVTGRGLGWVLATNRIPEGLRTSVILGAVLAVFTVGEHLHQEAGLLAVTIVGVVLANHHASIEDIHRFKEQVSSLLVGFLFVALSADLDLKSLGQLAGPPALAVLGLLLVSRPLMVGLATLGTRLNWGERALVAWIAPRGWSPRPWPAPWNPNWWPPTGPTRSCSPPPCLG